MMMTTKGKPTEHEWANSVCGLFMLSIFLLSLLVKQKSLLNVIAVFRPTESSDDSMSF